MGYSLAAQFHHESSATTAMRRVKHVLAFTNPPLSVFQFYSTPLWYVAIVGESEDMRVFADLAVQLQRSQGTIIPLPDETHDALLVKRAGSRP